MWNDFLIFHWLKEINHWGKTPEGGISRLAFSQEDKGARKYVIDLMEEYGMEVRIDEAANIIGKYAGTEPDLPAVVIGSHLDSVPSGGKYDGVLGVLSGLEVVRHLARNNIRGRHSLEVIVFSNEEGCRYPYTLFGSSVMMGDFHKPWEEIKNMQDEQGIKLVQEIKELGGKPEKLFLARRNPEQIKAFLELHIEQGLVLEDKGVSIGIVEGISAPIRFVLKLMGSADHAGATPMVLRRDPLMGASEIMLALERIVKETSVTAVGTVGQINVSPGAVNIIPGTVTLSFDIRDIDLAARNQIVRNLEKVIREVCQTRDLKYDFREIFNISPVMLDTQMISLIEQVCQEMEIPAIKMISGAAHDAMVMANHVPTGMIFVPSVAGISHNPSEYTRNEDIMKGVEVLGQTVLRLIK